MPFTYDDFRSTAELRQQLALFLQSDCGMVLMRVMRQRYRPNDVPVSMDALASARLLSQYHGAHLCLDDLENAIMPPGLEQTEIPIDYPETDHERLPSDAEFATKIRVPTHLTNPTPMPPEEYPHA